VWTVPPKKLIKGVQGYKVRPSKWIKDVLKKQKEA
jgi:hypothetical protein